MKRVLAVIIACVMAASFTGTDARAEVIAPQLREILLNLNPDEELPVIVTLADQINTKNYKDKDKKLRRSRIIKALKNKAEKTQKNIKNFLKQNKVAKIKPFWIFNGLAVTAKAKVIAELAAMEGIASIGPDVQLSMPEPLLAGSLSPPEWNINMIRAPELWNRGYDGAGTVLASMDTGVDLNHQDLANRWRGGSNSWFDPHGQHATPYDSDYWGHGTGVMGVMVGGDAGGSAIGVAPGAQWISVKIFNDAGGSSYADIHAGFQWLLDPDGNPETDDAPDVVNNSWGFPELRNTCFTKFQLDIQALKAAGIGVVFSAGNGVGANTSESPANNPESFAVGAVDSTETIGFYSSQGPSACGGDIFPEVVAPGVNVKTADKGNYYAFVTGTSIAAPHVAGAMGLLLSAYSFLSVTEIETVLKESALDLGSVGPDNTYGYGLLDVMRAFNLLDQNYLQAPVAKNDFVTIPRNTTALITILANDVDPDGTIDVTSIVFRSGAADDITARGGSIVANTDGTITYTPEPEGNGGPDYFWYRVKDNSGVTSNEATVRINRVRNGLGNATAVPDSFTGRAKRR
jgi:bacillopeptidase F